MNMLKLRVWTCTGANGLRTAAAGFRDELGSPGCHFFVGFSDVVDVPESGGRRIRRQRRLARRVVAEGLALLLGVLGRRVRHDRETIQVAAEDLLGTGFGGIAGEIAE
jgi:hypothetical protein